MSSKLVSSTVCAVYYDKDDDQTYVFATVKGELRGFCCDGNIRNLDKPEVMLEKINEQRIEELNQLMSIQETYANQTRKAEEPAGAGAGSGANQVREVGGGVHQPPSESVRSGGELT